MKCQNKDCEHDAAYCYKCAKEEMKVTHLLRIQFDAPVKAKGDPLTIVSALNIKKNDFIIISGNDAEFLAHQLAMQGKNLSQNLGFNVPIIIMQDGGRIERKSIKSVKALLKRLEKAAA
jgi:hypothetical protein